MDESRLALLFEKYMNQSCTEDEKIELSEIIASAGNDDELNILLEKSWLGLNKLDAMEPVKAAAVFQSIMQQQKPKQQATQGKIRSLKLLRNVTTAAAAVLLVIAGVYLFTGKKSMQQNAAQTAQIIPAPASNNATITLYNGQIIELNKVNGTITKQGNVQVTKTADGQIVYEGAAKETLYNTLSNPRGSRVINITLQDGSKVWLNSESSLKYPAAFTGNERKVEVTGEAYFEVAHNAARPFVVSNNSTNITVLGTHFNVNAYKDDATLKVTLLEGSVRVDANTNQAVLKPGEQALINSTVTVQHNADVEQVMAWKNGLFAFKNADIKTLMSNIARWYDVNVQYDYMPSATFSGKINRNTNLDNVLKILEQSNVKFSISNKTITIKK